MWERESVSRSRYFFLALALISAVIFFAALTRSYTVEAQNAADPATQVAKLALLATAGTYLKSLAIARDTKKQHTA